MGRLIVSELWSHFKTPQSHGNDSEVRKLGFVRVEAERFRTEYSRCQVYALLSVRPAWCVYYELLKPSETFTDDLYRTQLMRLSRALKEKWLQYQDRHEKLSSSMIMLGHMPQLSRCCSFRL